MGMDLSYHAIPHDSPALERARHDAVFCCELEFWSSYATPSTQREAMMQAARASKEEHDGAFIDAVELARAAAREHPGMEARSFSWGRGYDAVHSLLSPARRNGNREQDWVHQAIYGAQALHAQGTTTIGFPIRYSSPDEVRAFAEIIGAATRDDLLQHFDPAKMSGRVYKYLGDPDGFDNWIWPQFEEWRDFLLSMLDFPGEGLICCVG